MRLPTVDEPVRFQVNVTAERITAALPAVHRTMVLQNARFAAGSDRRLRVFRRAGMAVGGLGFALCALLAVLAKGTPAAASLAVIAIAFLAVLALYAFAPRLRAWLKPRSQRWATRSLARTAHRKLRANLRRAPYTADYELTGSTLAADVPKLRFKRSVDVRRFALGMFAPGVALLFRREGSFSPARIVFVPGDAELAALRVGLSRAGVAVRDVPDGFPEGYVLDTPPPGRTA